MHADDVLQEDNMTEEGIALAGLVKGISVSGTCHEEQLDDCYQQEVVRAENLALEHNFLCGRAFQPLKPN